MFKFFMVTSTILLFLDVLMDGSGKNWTSVIGFGICVLALLILTVTGV